ncbi:hypothetical protein L9F63_002248, partial [Diploptera punctata]
AYLIGTFSALYPNTFLRTQKSVHAIIIVEIPKLPAKMSDLEDFDLVFAFFLVVKFMLLLFLRLMRVSFFNLVGKVKFHFL